MASRSNPRRRSDVGFAGAGLLMALCCAAGPAVIGAVAGSALGGWLGMACAGILAVGVGVVFQRRTRRRGGAC